MCLSSDSLNFDRKSKCRTAVMSKTKSMKVGVSITLLSALIFVFNMFIFDIPITARNTIEHGLGGVGVQLSTPVHFHTRSRSHFTKIEPDLEFSQIA